MAQYSEGKTGNSKISKTLFKSMPILRNFKDIREAVFEEICQFFGVSKKPSMILKFKSTDYTILKSICSGLLGNIQDQPEKLILLVYIFILETIVNHSILVNSFMELQNSMALHEGRKSTGSKKEKHHFKFDSLVSFSLVTSEDFKNMYNWLGSQMLNQRAQFFEGKYLEFLPTFIFPNFSPIKLLSEKQKSLVKSFMKIAAKRMHQSRNFIVHLRAKNFMEYSDLVSEYQMKFKYLSEQKKSESIFNFSHTCSEYAAGDEFGELHESPIPLTSLRRMKSLHGSQMNRPRFNSDTLRYGLQPIPTSGKKISHSNHAVHVQPDSKTELISEPQLCATCDSRITGLFWMCTKCFHGGHINHIAKWFRDHQYCAKCFNCKCRE